MGVDYARATLPYAVRSITDEDKSESLYDLILSLHEHESEELTTPFDFMGWTYMFWTGAWSDSPHHLRDSGNYADHPMAWQLTKDNMQVWLVQEGYIDYNPFYSVGAETLESLTAFLSDIGLPDAPIVERYVFFLIW